MAYRNNLEDESAIRDLAARYIDAVNRFDGDAWRDTWAEQSSWSLMGQTIEGRDTIYEFWKNTMGMFDHVVMALNSGSLDIDGDSASGRWYISEFLAPSGTDPMVVQGVYDDTYVRENGEWRCATRAYQVLHSTPGNPEGQFTPYEPA